MIKLKPIVSLKELLNKSKKLILYGAGFWAPEFIHFCEKNKISIKCILDKRFKNYNNFFLNLPALTLEQAEKEKMIKKNDIIIITVIKDDIVNEIKEILKAKNFKNVYSMFEIKEYIDYLIFYLKKVPKFKLNKQNYNYITYNNKVVPEIAVIVHAYYPKIFSEMLYYLNNITNIFDLYVSVDTEEKKEEVKKLFNDSSLKLKVNLFMVHIFPNRGRDVAPFIKVFKKIYNKNYKLILKLHTKKSSDPFIGTVWRRQLYTRLIGNEKIFEKVKETFYSDEKAGLIAPAGYLYPIKFYSRENKKHLKKILNYFDLPENYEGSFSLGTMFWFRREAFKPLEKVDLRKIKFEDEKGQLDGTWAHAFERFFGILPVVKGYKLIQIDEDGNIYENP